MRIDDAPHIPTLGPGSASPTATPGGSQAFVRALEQAQADLELAANSPTLALRTIKTTDNLSQIVRQEAQSRGLGLSASQEFRAVQELAKANQISNPNLIVAGRQLNLTSLHRHLASLQAGEMVAATGAKITIPSPTTAAATLSSTPASAPAASTVASPGSSLAATIEGASADAEQSLRIVRANDSLSRIVRQEASSRGVQLSAAQEYRAVMALARDNQIANPDRIITGQRLDMRALQTGLQDPQGDILAQGTGPQSARSNVSPPSTQAVLSAKAATLANASAQPGRAAREAVLPHPVLHKTLDRAVARGFIPAIEKQDVYNKILQVAQKHRFSPDDFARLTLMESDGMNPQATNQRCHGIIQFCDGPARGAAGVGYGQSPRAILGLSVYQQLHLVDTYFDQVGLRKQGRQVSLDELYLAVLQPAARAETRPEVPLDIPGNQAHVLYEGHDPQSWITRNSILQGLLKNTVNRLGLGPRNPSSNTSGPAVSPSPGLPPPRNVGYRVDESPEQL